jgi:hypothetical protein
MERLLGKCLVRKARGKDGKMYVVIAGTFIPSEPLETFSDRDEMWAVEFIVADVRKFEGRKESTGFHGGPEEFLEGSGQDPAGWDRKL